MKMLLFLILILFLSKSNCINVHLSLSNADSAFLSSSVMSGLIRTGAWNEAILVKVMVASVDRGNLMRIGLGVKHQICICPNGSNP